MRKTLINIAVMNASSAVTDAEVAAATKALQTQVSRDFAPAWGIDAKLTIHNPTNPPADQWWLVILDHSDQAGALGYHDLTTTGLPLGKIFAGTDKQTGNSWTVTASHELLEMLGDPDINLTAFIQPNDTSGTLLAYEVCDACEADEFGYQIDGVLVSDFVYPSWFMSFFDGKSVQFDFMKKIGKPFELLPGGYIGAFDVASGSGWHQITNEKTEIKFDMRARVGSRRERRRTLRQHWMKSKPNHQAIQAVQRGYTASTALIEAAGTGELVK